MGALDDAIDRLDGARNLLMEVRNHAGQAMEAADQASEMISLASDLLSARLASQLTTLSEELIHADLRAASLRDDILQVIQGIDPDGPGRMH